MTDEDLIQNNNETAPTDSGEPVQPPIENIQSHHELRIESPGTVPAPDVSSIPKESEKEAPAPIQSDSNKEVVFKPVPAEDPKEEVKTEASQIQKKANPTPIIQTDPLVTDSSFVHEIITGSNAAVHKVEKSDSKVATKNEIFIKKPKKHSIGFKIFILILFITFIGILGVGGYFGWHYGRRYVWVKTINAATEKFQAVNSLSVDFQASILGTTTSGKINMDKEKDLLITMNLGGESANVKYIFAQDKAYLAGPENQYLVFTNIKKSLAQLGSEVPKDQITGTGGVTKKDLTAMKFLEGETAQINGIDCYHFTFEPNQAYIDKEINKTEEMTKANMVMETYKIEGWIGKNDQQLYRLKTDMTYTGRSKSTDLTPSRMDLALDLKFNYSFAEDIIAPASPIIVQMIDFSALVETKDTNSILKSI